MFVAALCAIEYVSCAYSDSVSYSGREKMALRKGTMIGLLNSADKGMSRLTSDEVLKISLRDEKSITFVMVPAFLRLCAATVSLAAI